jgi:tetratricopeptide (TPR) repeat protein
MENRAEHLLESYFANALTAAEATELKTLASADPAVAAELDFQQRVSTALKPCSLAESIQHPEWRAAAHKPFSASAIKVSMLPRYAYAAAAALALLIVAYVFIMPPSLQSVVAKNAVEYPNKMKFKSLGDAAESVPENVIQAFAQYDKAQYREAALDLQAIVTSNPDRMDYRFYWGVSLVKNKQYSEAVEALTPIIQSQDERKIPAHYYLGLACAGKGDKACARQNLQAYVDSPEGVTFRKAAKAVLEAL